MLYGQQLEIHTPTFYRQSLELKIVNETRFSEQLLFQRPARTPSRLSR